MEERAAVEEPPELIGIQRPEASGHGAAGFDGDAVSDMMNVDGPRRRFRNESARGFARRARGDERGRIGDAGGAIAEQAGDDAGESLLLRSSPRVVGGRPRGGLPLDGRADCGVGREPRGKVQAALAFALFFKACREDALPAIPEVGLFAAQDEEDEPGARRVEPGTGAGGSIAEVEVDARRSVVLWERCVALNRVEGHGAAASIAFAFADGLLAGPEDLVGAGPRNGLLVAQRIEDEHGARGVEVDAVVPRAAGEADVDAGGAAGVGHDGLAADLFDDGQETAP